MSSGLKLGRKQILALKKLHNFIKDPGLPGENQSQIRLDCLKEWSVPDHGQLRDNERYDSIDEYFANSSAIQCILDLGLIFLRVQVPTFLGAISTPFLGYISLPRPLARPHCAAWRVLLSVARMRPMPIRCL